MVFFHVHFCCLIGIMATTHHITELSWTYEDMGLKQSEMNNLFKVNRLFVDSIQRNQIKSSTSQSAHNLFKRHVHTRQIMLELIFIILKYSGQSCIFIHVIFKITESFIKATMHCGPSVWYSSKVTPHTRTRLFSCSHGLTRNPLLHLVLSRMQTEVSWQLTLPTSGCSWWWVRGSEARMKIKIISISWHYSLWQPDEIWDTVAFIVQWALPHS